MVNEQTAIWLSAIIAQQDSWFRSRKEMNRIFRIKNHPQFAVATEAHLLLAIEVGEKAAEDYAVVESAGLKSIAEICFTPDYGGYELVTTVADLRDWAERPRNEHCKVCDDARQFPCECGSDSECLNCGGAGSFPCDVCGPYASRPAIVGGAVASRGLITLMLSGAPGGELTMRRKTKVATPDTPFDKFTVNYALRFAGEGWAAVLMPMRTNPEGLPQFTPSVRGVALRGLGTLLSSATKDSAD